MCRVSGDGSVIEPVWGKHLRRAETTAVVSWSKNWFTNASGFFLERFRIDSQKLNNWNFELLIILFIERDPRDKSLDIQRDSMRCSTMQNQHVGMCTEDLNCKAQKNKYIIMISIDFLFYVFSFFCHWITLRIWVETETGFVCFFFCTRLSFTTLYLWKKNCRWQLFLNQTIALESQGS